MGIPLGFRAYVRDVDIEGCLALLGEARADLAGRTSGEPEIERAFEELAGAILLVSTGRSPAVLISNLAYCNEAIELTRPMADKAGIELELIPRVDGHGCDVAVRAG